MSRPKPADLAGLDAEMDAHLDLPADPTVHDRLDAAEDLAGDALTPAQYAAAGGVLQDADVAYTAVGSATNATEVWVQSPRPGHPADTRRHRTNPGQRPRAVPDPREMTPQQPDTRQPRLRTTVPDADVQAWRQARESRRRARTEAGRWVDSPTLKPAPVFEPSPYTDGVPISGAALDVLAARERMARDLERRG